jgi:exopolysaccharide biosynthesis polyprenyl glycosylphosphotransferase
MPHRHSNIFIPFAALLDLLGLNSSFAFAYYVKFGDGILKSGVNYLYLWAVANVVWIVIVFFKNPYHFPRIKFHVPEVVVQLVGMIIVHVGVIAIYWLLINRSIFSRQHIVLFYLFWALFSIVIRVIGILILKIYRTFGYNNRRYVIVGYGPLAKSIKHFYANNIEMGFKFYGFFDDIVGSESKYLIGKISTVRNFVQNKQIDCIYCCSPYMTAEDIRAIVAFSDNNDIDVKIIVNFTSFLDRSSYIEYHDIIPVISFANNTFRNNINKYFFKRLFDVIFAMLTLLIGMPVFIIVAIITKVSSVGPIFYSQERIGWRGVPFMIYKFRSMYVDAEILGPSLSSGQEDRRITPWGKFMRKTRIDELPQFYNVLIGDMSIVGPRPEREFFINQIVEIAPEYTKLLSLKPGITSLGQIRYGYASSIDEMVQRLRYDLIYIKRVSLFVDMMLIMQTLVVMVKGKGK